MRACSLLAKSLVLLLALLFASGCMEPKQHYNGELLLKEKCVSCHNLEMPPKTYKDEKAPPMMAVAFHVKDFMKVSTPSDKKPKFIEFFKDYVLHPSAEKSFCDKESLQSYGVMPSQAGSVSADEVGAIAEYVYDFYDQEKFLAQMKARAAFEALPKGEQIATRKGCLTCHAKTGKKVAPSFQEMAKRDKKEIVDAILHGSHGRWKGYERMRMPPFEGKITKQEIDTLIAWMRGL